jgi:glycosyltransferase involved in cell wall biosynthesis
MTTNISLLQTLSPVRYPDTIESIHRRPIEVLSPNESLPEILFITSFPPRECGIATYSQDLIQALHQQFEHSFSCTICALESDTEQHLYAHPPKFILNTSQRYDFAQTAWNINNDENIQWVVIQHEFGFFASKEKEFKLLFDRIIKPIIFVFHTVLPNPNSQMKSWVQDMAAVASSIIVMTRDAAQILSTNYQIAPYKITVIPHGTHLVPPVDKEELKTTHNASGRKVLSTFGLLSLSKNIETTLDALPEIIQIHPEILFLILGKTHPSVVKQEGEKYRSLLEQKVKDLHLESHVRFVNQYLPLPILLEYLQLTDIYLFTSKDPNQAVSGTFSYALSCGCPIISTPIPHAKEVLSDRNGIIIDFGQSDQLAQAVIALLDDHEKRSFMSSDSQHKMASTAWQNAAIAHVRLLQSLSPEAITLHFRIPPYNFKHIHKLTTPFGMIQFSKIALPDIHTGYTLDDNARALLALSQYYVITPTQEGMELIQRYLNFIGYCQQSNGSFLNYVNQEKEFTTQNDQENLQDSTGRTIWALGYVCGLKEVLPIELTEEAERMLLQAMPHLPLIHSVRAMAFIIKGLHYQRSPENYPLLKTLANRLVQMYKHETNSEWQWFENCLTYGNSALPEAMLFAYLSTGNLEYKCIAKESFDFLLSKIIVDGKIKVVSNNGWHMKGHKAKIVVGGEQPIDVAYSIMALENFYHVFMEEEYYHHAQLAFNWFLGDNHLHQIVYNPITGGCYDGVEEKNVNLNQGAESTLSYLLARLVMDRIHASRHSIFESEYHPEIESVYQLSFTP